MLHVSDLLDSHYKNVQELEKKGKYKISDICFL